MEHLISWFNDNSRWELIVVVMMTIVTRVFKWTFGKKMTTKHEIWFWAVFIICGTIALDVANVGVIKPIQSELASQRPIPPNFQSQIRTIAIGTATFTRTNVLGLSIPTQVVTKVSTVTLFVRIGNGGGPSFAWYWKLRIILPNGQSVESQAYDSPTFATGRYSSNEVTLPNDRYLPNLLGESPLPNGAGKDGWVEFAFENISPEDLNRFGNKYILQFQDSAGKITETDYTITSMGHAP